MKISELLKRILPASLVGTIKRVKRALRLRKYYAINNGLSFIRRVESCGACFKIYINPYTNGEVDAVIYETGEWEPAVSHIIKNRLPKEGAFLDIGANIGYYSLFAKSVQGEHGKVFAFEPLPTLCTQMNQSILENSYQNLTVLPYGLSNTSGKAELLLIDENIGASSIKRKTTDPLVQGAVSIELRTLDSFAKMLPAVDLIKIDIEGNEYEALLGGELLLTKYLPDIILEFNPSLYEADRAGKTLEFVMWLEKIGYQLYTLHNEPLNIRQELAAGNMQQRDIFCTAKF